MLTKFLWSCKLTCYEYLPEHTAALCTTLYWAPTNAHFPVTRWRSPSLRFTSTDLPGREISGKIESPPLSWPFSCRNYLKRRSQWSRGLRRRSVAARLLRSWVRVPPGGGMDLVCLLWVLCVVRERSLWRADHSSRGVLPTVLRRCVWSRNLKNDEAMTRVGSQRQNKINK